MQKTTKQHRSLAALVVFLGLLLSSPAQAACPDTADDYNPFLLAGIVSPAPLLPVEFNGTGQVAFQVGNTGSTELCLVETQEMGMTITLSKGVPDNVDPIAAISGAGKDWFDWSYNAGTTTYTATQNQTIPANSSEQIVISYDVTVNSFFSASPTTSNGFNNNLSPPDYANSNAPGDDAVFDYTYVLANDDGDAPISYGSALHGVLTGSVPLFYLGSHVDAEATLQPSVLAVGDNNNTANGINGVVADDEDGLSWPSTLSIGVNAVPISVTRGDQGAYDIDWWVDWNQNGTFETGENSFFEVGSRDPNPTEINVVVPGGTPDGYYYVRVRVHTPGVISATEALIGGEVEDYLIIVGDPTAVTIGKVDLQAVSVEDILDGLGIDQMDAAALLAILKAWDPELAASLAGAGRDAILAALQQYLDPDGDGQVAVLKWDTLEERGTIGFYVKRADDNGRWILVNNDMLPGLINAPMGGEYLLADPVPQSGESYQYLLIEQEATGNTRQYGPYNVEMP